MLGKIYIWALFLLLGIFFYPAVLPARQAVVSEIGNIDLSGVDLVRIEAQPSQGFNYPFFIFLPKTIDKNIESYLYVEPNNTGTASDEYDVHLNKARQLAQKSYASWMARRLGVVLLVPVFPRPRTNWQCYTQALDRDTLKIKEGKMKRIDLQLKAMIDYAKRWLRAHGFLVHDRIFMHGFSSSASFCNRFAYLHPEYVKAVATGGINGLPTLPIKKRNDQALPFPIGIADIKSITGHPFNQAAYKNIAQYIYMGSADGNDTLEFRDAWSEQEARIIKEATCEKMMPDRWDLSRAIYAQHLPRSQCVTYDGVGHTIKDEMLGDIVKFFQSNSGPEFKPIQPHIYDDPVEITREEQD